MINTNAKMTSTEKSACPIEENKFLIHPHERLLSPEKCLEMELDLEEAEGQLQRGSATKGVPGRFDFLRSKVTDVLTKILPANDVVQSATKVHASDLNLRAVLNRKKIISRVASAGFDSPESLQAFLRYGKEGEDGGKTLNLTTSYFISLLENMGSITTEGYSGTFEGDFRKYIKAKGQAAIAAEATKKAPSSPSSSSPSSSAFTGSSPETLMGKERLQAIRLNVLLNIKYILKYPTLTQSLESYSKSKPLQKKFDKKDLGNLRKILEPSPNADLSLPPSQRASPLPCPASTTIPPPLPPPLPLRFFRAFCARLMLLGKRRRRKNDLTLAPTTLDSPITEPRIFSDSCPFLTRPTLKRIGPDSTPTRRRVEH